MSGHPRRGRQPSASGRRIAVLGVALLGLGLGAAPAVATAAPAVLVVGVAGPACRAPGYATVIAAVQAAAPGATITVCPGVYPGTVEVDKSLTIRGAQQGRDARGGRTAESAESVVDGLGSTGFRITAAAAAVTIDGFTIRNAGTPGQNADGIDAFAVGGAVSIVNNIITETTYGVNLSARGVTPSTVARNRFVNNNRTGGQGGSGVFICCGPGNNLSISDNLFSGHSSAAVNTAGDPSNRSTGLRIERNRSIDDATFAVVVNAVRASVADNIVIRTPQAGQAAGSAVFVGGGTDGVQIARNIVVGTAAATGIRVTNLFGPVNTGLVVSGNQVVDRLNGIRLSGQTSGSITRNNVVRSAAVGILLDADNAGVAVTGNVVAAGPLDCRDDSRGGGTAGTASTWTGNVGLRSTPRGICGRF